MKNSKAMACMAILALSLTSLAAAPPIRADGPLVAPESVEIRQGRNAIIKVECPTQVTWIDPDDEDLEMLPYIGNSVLVRTDTLKTFKLNVAAAIDGKVVVRKIEITVKPKNPAPPVPPTPPTPPVPPTPPAPTDPLARDLISAYTLEAQTDKAAAASRLAAIYRTGADKVGDFDTGNKLTTAMRQVAKDAGVKDEDLPLIRARISVEIKKVLVAGPLSAEQKSAAKSLFARVAAALEGVK